MPTPKKFTLCAGAADGFSKLNAFDNALLQAGIGNVNLVRISSILPPGIVYTPELELLPGALTPVAYGSIASEVPAEVIAAAIGVGVGGNGFGVIMEYSGKCSRPLAELKVTEMVRAAFSRRQMEPMEIMVKAVEHLVADTGCAFAAAVLWY